MQSIVCMAETGNSVIYTGESISNFENYLNGRKTVIITDHNIRKLYGRNFEKYPSIVIGSGEDVKNLSTVDDIIRQLIELGCDRKTFILGIGGGIVTDITGFTASIFMRGVEFGFISTTLLSQVDASVGGKNGVNSGILKNMIGVFHQPEFVICDPETVQSLSEDEYLSGLGEVIKHGFIRSRSLLEFLDENFNSVMNRDRAAVEKMVYESVKIKSEVVISDPRESGLRKILNFGHTFGHAAELLGRIPHGHSVAFGMMLAIRLSHMKGCLADEKAEYGAGLIRKFGFAEKLHIDENEMFQLLGHDKKKSGSAVDFVLLNDLGNAFIEKLEIEELRSWYNDLCCSS